MSSFGVKTCGDYLYSGHTCTLVLATHFINECMYRFQIEGIFEILEKVM
jgi:hypothetical protein